jgi:serine/threonine-protein kinase/endoribonuclease IRE1
METLKYTWGQSLHQRTFLGKSIGMAYIHEQRLAHRDVKPENVLISLTNDIVQMKWADFGLSKSVNKNGSYATRGVQGTKQWLAPELLEKSSGTTLSRYKRCTVKSDVFAEGSLFAYFLSDGKHPFDDEHWDISALNVLTKNPNLTSMFDFILENVNALNNFATNYFCGF